MHQISEYSDLQNKLNLEIFIQADVVDSWQVWRSLWEEIAELRTEISARDISITSFLQPEVGPLKVR
jgi:hypothetical protein